MTSALGKDAPAHLVSAPVVMDCPQTTGTIPAQSTYCCDAMASNPVYVIMTPILDCQDHKLLIANHFDNDGYTVGISIEKTGHQ
jgi:hypothetical protein